MNAVETLILTTIAADATLVTLGLANKPNGDRAVYEGQASQNTDGTPIVAPYIVFFKMGASRDDRTHDRRVSKRPAYTIKVVDQGTSNKRAGQIDERCEDLFSGETFATIAGRFQCFRTGDMPAMTETVAGKTFKSVGGLYRFSQVK